MANLTMITKFLRNLQGNCASPPPPHPPPPQTITSTGRLICQCGCGGRHTLDNVWDVISWSLHISMTGILPLFRYDGRKFADSSLMGSQKRARKLKKQKNLRVRGGCIQKRADWSWMKNLVGMCGWRDGPHKRCCMKCLANLTTIPMTDFSEMALWRQTLLTHAAFIADKQGN